MKPTGPSIKKIGARHLPWLVALGCFVLAGCATGPPYTITDSPPKPVPYKLNTKAVRKALLVVNHIALRNDRAKYEEQLARQKVEVTQGARDTVLASHGEFPSAGPNLGRALIERLSASGRAVVRPSETRAVDDITEPQNARKVARRLSADTVIIADIAQCAFTAEDRYYTSPGPQWTFISLKREFAVRVTIKVIDTETGRPLFTTSLTYSVLGRVVGERDRRRMKTEGLELEKLMDWDAKVWPTLADAFIAAFRPPEGAEPAP